MSDMQLFWLLYVTGLILTYIIELRRVWQDKLKQKVTKISAGDRFWPFLFGIIWPIFWLSVGTVELVYGLDSIARPTKLYKRIIRDTTDLRAVNGGKKKEIVPSAIVPKVQSRPGGKPRSSIRTASVAVATPKSGVIYSDRAERIHKLRELSRSRHKNRKPGFCLCHVCSTPLWLVELGDTTLMDMSNYKKYPKQHPYMR